MTSVSKNMYIDKLSDLVNKYSNTYHNTIKRKLVDVKSSPYIDFNKENNNEDSKFEVSDHIRISKYENIFEVTQPAHDVPGTSSEGPLKVLMSVTYRGPSGDSQGTNTKTDDLMKNLFFRSNSTCIPRDVYGTQLRDVPVTK